MTATNASVPENGTTTVTITVKNPGETPSTAPVVQLGALPGGWRVVNESSPNATFRPSTREWLWVALGPGDSASVSVTVAAPANATSGITVPVTATDASDRRAATTLEITIGRQAGDAAGGGILAGPPLLVVGALGLVVVAGLLALVAVVGFFLYKRSSG